MKRWIHKTCLLFFGTLLFFSCESESEDTTPQARLTHEFLRFVDSDATRKRVKAWRGTVVEVTYYKPDGSKERSEERTNHKVYAVRFSEPGPHSDESSYLIMDADGLFDDLVPEFGRYELGTSNQVTFGDLRFYPFPREKEYNDMTF